ncbi:MAG: response regulator transcription factor [Fusobacteriaceae bacterium]
MKVLIVEDDNEILTLIEYFFTREGYSVDTAKDGLEGIKLLKKEKHNLVILDLMLPHLDGKNFAKIVTAMPEEYGEPKIIMLTAKTEIEDVLEGLSLGAADYMKKPFDPRELILRAKILLEIKNTNVQKKEDHIYILNDLVLNENTRIVKYDKSEIDLSKKEYDLLLILLKNIGLILTREKLLDYVWGVDYFLGDRSVDVYISKLREKIPFLSKHIKTVKGVGYRLEEKK